jgi:L-ascorbate metabolism protein UlaG (beta-lactamase superfamily)
MKIEYFGQSGVKMNIEQYSLGIDIWSNHPTNPQTLDSVGDLDYVFLTHDHGDHDMPFSLDLAIKNDSYYIAPYAISKLAKSKGISKSVSANVGGFFKVGGLEIMLTNAIHSSDTGIPVGFMIKSQDKIIYHMGDTGYLSEFKAYGEMYDIDLLFVPIGSTYTMDPQQALKAVQDINPKFAIPIHYNTFSKIHQDVDLFKKCVEDNSSTKVRILKPGEEVLL